MFKELLQKKPDNWIIQIVRSIMAGLLAFIVDFSFLYILTEFFHIHYLISVAVAYLLGLITIYILSIKWVFSKRKFKNYYSELAVFALIESAALGLNLVFIWLLTEKADIYYLKSKIISTMFVFVINFLAKKYILFI